MEVFNLKQLRLEWKIKLYLFYTDTDSVNEL